jgi:hypothetical protein
MKSNLHALHKAKVGTSVTLLVYRSCQRG